MARRLHVRLFEPHRSLIVIMALIVAAVILATQFSFGRLFSVIFAGASSVGAQGVAAFREWSEERRKTKQRREVMEKYGKKDAAAVIQSEKKTTRVEKPEVPVAAREKSPAPKITESPASSASATPVVQKKPVTRTPVTPPLPLSEPERLSADSARTRSRRHRCSMLRRRKARSTSAN